MDDYVPLPLVHSLEILLEAGSFRRAAERLHISPPAMTQQMKRLEATVGYTLIVRGEQPIRLTERGTEFMMHAREALEASRRAMGGARAAELRIGFISGYPRSLDEPFIEHFRTRNPGVHLEFVELHWSEQTAKLLAGDIDVALARRPFDHEDEIAAFVVHREPRIVAIAADSELATRPRVLLEQIDHLPVLRARGVSTEWNDYWSIDPRPSGRAVRYNGWCGSIESALNSVAASDGIIITAESIGVRFAHPGVRYVPVDDVPYCAVELCIRRADRRATVLALQRSAQQTRQSE